MATMTLGRLAGLQPLCDWAKCLTCGTSHPVAATTAPACCDAPVVLAVYTTGALTEGPSPASSPFSATRRVPA